VDSVAQQVEHIPFKDGVLGSSPSWITKKESECTPFFFADIYNPLGISCLSDFLEKSRWFLDSIFSQECFLSIFISILVYYLSLHKEIMSNFFRDKVVIVTGASSGIGKATAREFALRGSKVILASRSIEKLNELELELKAMNCDVAAIKTDVSCEDDCRRMVERTIEKYGRIDVLVNNAGISMKALFMDSNLDVLRKLMDVNFWGTVYCTKYALPYLLASRGSLVGVSSIAGFHGLPGRSGYSASKFAIAGFMETIRIEHLKNGLHVMIIFPGFTATEIRKHALLADGSEQGESPKDENTLMTSEYVAKWILKGIRRNKRNKILTWTGRLTALFQRIIPHSVDRLFYNALSREKNSPLK
jgi:short-subunit dehydrogenase